MFVCPAERFSAPGPPRPHWGKCHWPRAPVTTRSQGSHAMTIHYTLMIIAIAICILVLFRPKKVIWHT
jgi:hypothetical protein